MGRIDAEMQRGFPLRAGVASDELAHRVDTVAEHLRKIT